MENQKRIETLKIDLLILKSNAKLDKNKSEYMKNIIKRDKDNINKEIRMLRKNILI